MFKRISVIAFMWSTLMLQSAAGQNLSQAGAIFLNFTPGSRANGMAAAYTALADDFYALYYNPAAIARLQRGSVGIFHHDWLTADMPITFTGAVYAMKFGTIGLAFNNLDSDVRDVVSGKELDAYERALQVTFGRDFGLHIAVGASVKWVREKFAAEFSDDAWTLDIGFLVQNLFPHWTYFRRSSNFPQRFRKFDRPEGAKGLSLAVSLLNSGPDGFEFETSIHKSPLPQTLRLGAALNAIDTDEVGVVVALDFDKFLVERENDGAPKGFAENWFAAWDGGFDNFRIGAEIEIYHVFAFRFGRHENMHRNLQPGREPGVTEWTFGLGLGPEWARLNLVHRGFPIGFEEKWVADLALSY